MMKCGIPALSLFSIIIIMIEYLTSKFIIPCSIFAFSKFLLRFDRPFFAGGGAEPLNI